MAANSSPPLAMLGPDLLGPIAEKLGAEAGTLRLLSRDMCAWVDQNRKRLQLHPAMMLQHLFMERVAATAPGNNHSSWVVNALANKWRNVEIVVAFGSCPEPWMPQLVESAVAAGQLPLLQELVLDKLTWRHADGRLALVNTHCARIYFLAECISQSALPAGEALGLLLPELHLAGSALALWVTKADDTDADSEEQDAEHMVSSRRGQLQTLLTTLGAILAYSGNYADVRRLLTADLQHVTLSPAVCKAWARETLVLAQLERGELEGAVADIVSAPSWAHVHTLGRYVARALEELQQQQLARRVTDHLAVARQAQPGALEDWDEELEDASCETCGLMSAYDTWLEAPEQAEERARRERAAAGIAAVARLLATGRTQVALRQLLSQPHEGLSASAAQDVFYLHVLPSLHLHPYSVGGPAAAGLTAQLFAARSELPPWRVHVGVAHELLSCLTWLALNRGDAAALEGAELGPEAPAAPASAAEAGGCGGELGQGEQRQQLPAASGVVEQAAVLLGLSLDLVRGSCGAPTTYQCRHELALLAAPAAPGMPPAYTLLPFGASLLQRLLLRHQCVVFKAAGEAAAGPALTGPNPGPYPIHVQYDVDAAALGLLLSQRPADTAVALSLDRLCVKLGTAARNAGGNGGPEADPDLDDALGCCIDQSLMRSVALALFGRAEHAVTLLAGLQGLVQGQQHDREFVYELVMGSMQALDLAAGQPSAHGPQAVAAMRCGQRLLAQLPDDSPLWGADGPQATACCEVLGRLLLLPQPPAGAGGEEDEEAAALLQRMLWARGPPQEHGDPAGPEAAAADAWHERASAWCQQSALLLGDLLWPWQQAAGQPHVLEATQRLVRLLYRLLAARWPGHYAKLMGELLCMSPQWLLPQEALAVAGVTPATDPWGALGSTPRMWLMLVSAYLHKLHAPDADEMLEAVRAMGAQKMAQLLLLAPREAWEARDAQQQQQERVDEGLGKQLQQALAVLVRSSMAHAPGEGTMERLVPLVVVQSLRQAGVPHFRAACSMFVEMVAQAAAHGGVASAVHQLLELMLADGPASRR